MNSVVDAVQVEERRVDRPGVTGAARSPIRRGCAALVAQLDRASDFESEGREFESLRARQHLAAIAGSRKNEEAAAVGLKDCPADDFTIISRPPGAGSR